MRRTETELRLTVNDDGTVHFGQRVYVVSRTDYKTFAEKCPICDDEKKITVKGMQFDCPYCRGYRSDREATHISIYNYEPWEYIINKVEIVGEEVRAAYNRDGSIADGRYPYTRYSGFAKYGNSSSSVSTKSFSRYNFDKHDPNTPLLGRDIGGEYCFLTKAEAEAFVKRIHERQKEMLDKFNKDHGTDHPYPFEY